MNPSRDLCNRAVEKHTNRLCRYFVVFWKTRPKFGISEQTLWRQFTSSTQNWPSSSAPRSLTNWNGSVDTQGISVTVTRCSLSTRVSVAADFEKLTLAPPQRKSASSGTPDLRRLPHLADAANVWFDGPQRGAEAPRSMAGMGRSLMTGHALPHQNLNFPNL